MLILIWRELVIVQNMTVANATIAAAQLTNIPQYLESALGPLQSKLGDIATKLSPICGAIPVDENTANEMNANGLLNNGLLNLADEMVKQQQDFLTSIEEAPSKVYSGTGTPAASPPSGVPPKQPPPAPSSVDRRSPLPQARAP